MIIQIDNFFIIVHVTWMKIDLSKLRELREKAGLTRRDLADKIGCREHTIVRWENGENKKPLSPYRKELEKFYEEMLIK